MSVLCVLGILLVASPLQSFAIETNAPMDSAAVNTGQEDNLTSATEEAKVADVGPMDDSENEVHNYDATLDPYRVYTIMYYDHEGILYIRGALTGNLLSEPDAPTKEGYIFNGWFTEEIGGRRWNFGVDTMPEHNLELYAQFVLPTRYQVTYVGDTGVLGVRDAMAGTLLDEPNTPTKQGYVFRGWFTAASGGQKWNFKTDRMPESNLSLYAQFVQDVHAYEVTYLDDHGILIETDHGVPGDILNEPAIPTRLGYTFTGWYTARSGGERWNFASDIMPERNLTLYARYVTRGEYDVRYYDDRGVMMSTFKAMSGDVLREPNAPTKPGYRFTGWYTASSGGQRWNFVTDRMPARMLSLYPQFVRRDYPVKYHDDRGILETMIDGVVGEKLVEPNEPTLPGYAFTGWYTARTGGQRWNFATDKMPARAIWLYPRFVRRSYTVRYHDDRGILQETIDGIIGEKLSEPTAPTKPGFKFTGWYTSLLGGQRWNFKTDKMPAREISLYPQFVRSGYQLRYYDDRGVLMNTVDANIGAAIRAPRNPTKPGYTFTGWYTARTGGEKWDFKLDRMPAMDLSLYARFVRRTSLNLDEVTSDDEATDVEVQWEGEETDDAESELDVRDGEAVAPSTEAQETNTVTEVEDENTYDE